MRKFNKRRKSTSVSTFDFPSFYRKLLCNKLLTVFSSLTNFFFDEGENKFITVNTYGSSWVKISKIM